MVAWRPGTPLANGSTYYLRVIVRDEHWSDDLSGEEKARAESEPSEVVSFTVQLPNRAPYWSDGPDQAIVSPQRNEKLDTYEPTLTVANAIDDDGDQLTYSFMVYRDRDAKDLVVSSSGVSQGEAQTSWKVNEPLLDGIYYWKAQASDGSLSTDTALSNFEVRAGYAPGGEGGGDEGCGCAVSSSSPEGGGLLLVLLGMGLLGWIRRGRGQV